MSSSPFTRLPVALAIALFLAGSTQSAAQQTAGSVRARALAEEQAKRDRLAEDNYGVIDGLVTDTLLHPMNVADVTVVGTGARVTTGESGKFRFQKVPPGQYLLVVRRIGYAPASGVILVKALDTLRLSYMMARSIVAMDTIRVNATRVSLRMLEFEARARAGFGQFMNQATIDRRPSLQAMDLLRQFRGIEVSRNTSGAFAGTFALSKREGGAMKGGCPMQVLLDGIVLPRNFDLELLPPPKQLAGIEVYEGAATIPPQFGGADRSCGLIAVWTRDGY
ncbi:MAG: carboxypeptidase regulatory-like domain-containing protein [Gemmatimonadaceae bacterium]